VLGGEQENCPSSIDDRKILISLADAYKMLGRIDSHCPTSRFINSQRVRPASTRRGPRRCSNCPGSNSRAKLKGQEDSHPPRLPPTNIGNISGARTADGEPLIRFKVTQGHSSVGSRF
jgi:hypothetical protein